MTSNLLKGFEKRTKFQLSEEGCDCRNIQIVGFGVFQIQFDLEISFDLRQIAAEIGIGFVGFELGLPAIFDLVDVGINVIERLIFFDELNCRLFTDASHARDIIGLVTDERFVIHDMLGEYAKFFDNVLVGDEIFIVARKIDNGALAHELEQVAVAGDDLDTESLFGGDARHGAEHIVRFKAFHFQARNVERIHHFADAFDLRTQIIGHFFARAFIFREHCVAKSFAYIKSDCQVFGLFVFKDAQQLASEAINSSSGFAFRCLPALTSANSGEGEVHAIGEGVSVNEVKGRGHVSFQ